MPKHETTGINLAISGDLKPREVAPEELARAMDPELEGFQKWFRDQGNEPLTRMERSILKTYLAWKLLYEEDDVDSAAGGRSNG